MNNSSNNPYLSWLFEHGAPPFPGNMSDAVSAMKVLRRKISHSTRLIKNTSGVKVAPLFTHHCFLGTALDWMSCWIERTYLFHDVSTHSEWAALLESINRSSDRYRNTVSYDPAFTRSLRSLLRTRSITKATRLLVETSLQLPLKSVKGESALRRLVAQKQVREKQLEERLASSQGVYVESIDCLRQLHPSHRRAARREAREAGLGKGYLFKPNTPEFSGMISYAKDPAIRYRGWKTLQETHSTLNDAEKNLQCRSQVAQDTGYSSWMEKVSSRCALGNARTMEAILKVPFDGMKKNARALTRARLSKVQRLTRKKINPVWDGERLDALVPPNVMLQEVPADIFPWEATARKALPELFAIGGWCLNGSITKTRCGDREVLCLRFKHAEKGRALLFYSPNDPSFTPFDAAGAFAQSICTRWKHGPEKEQVMWIGQSVPSGSFDLTSLTYMVHEVGHILHYMAVAGDLPDEASTLPDDVVELPAYLLEFYVRDPKVLRRWDASSRPKPASYWKRRLKEQVSDVLEFSEDVLNGLFDIQVHQKDSEISCSDLYRKLRAGNPLTVLPEAMDLDLVNAFVWTSDLAGLHASHIMGKALVRRLMTVGDGNLANAVDVADLYKELSDNVLSNARDTTTWRQAWRRWLSESTQTSMKQGFLAMCRHYGRISRRAIMAMEPTTR